MERNDAPISVWNEIRISDEGVSVTLYSETADSGAVVEDEAWFTHDEIDEMSGSIESLRLSMDSREALVGDDSQELPEVGDWLIDDSPPSWSDDASVEVTGVLEDVQANEFVIGSGPVPRSHVNDWEDTVASENPQYPEDDVVILGRYVHQSGEQEYAFPASRLVEPRCE